MSPCLQPPLVQAIFNRNAEEVQLLLHKKEDVNALVRITWCCWCGCAEGSGFIKRLLLRVPIDSCGCSSPQDQERRTPLHAAACVGDVHIMDLLIESGWSPSCFSRCRPISVIHDHNATVKPYYLTPVSVLTGASVNAKDHVWLTPLHRAAASRNEVGHPGH